MLGKRILPCSPQADGEIIAAFAKSSTSIISDNLERLPGAIGLRPFHRVAGTMAGTALTVRVAAGDNYAIHKALDLVRPGDVVVVDGDGDLNRALVGEIMTSIAKSRGAVGMVINGAIRDAGALAASDFPCFARTAIHRGPYKNGPGEINVPVSIGGMIVSPGDIVVGDEDGVVAFPQEIAAELLKAVWAQEQKEADILASIANGTYVGAYAK
jgi:RraA family protein